MTIHCDGQQDEVLCEYQTDQCGEESIQAGDKCWTVVKNINISSWDEAYDECRSRGQTLLNLPSMTDIDVMFRLINLVNSKIYNVGLFTGLHTTERPKETPLLTLMYAKSLFWSDGSVAMNILYPRYGFVFVFQKKVCGYFYKHRYDVEIQECGEDRETKGKLTIVCERPVRKNLMTEEKGSLRKTMLNHTILLQNSNLDKHKMSQLAILFSFRTLFFKHFSSKILKN